MSKQRPPVGTVIDDPFAEAPQKPPVGTVIDDPFGEAEAAPMPKVESLDAFGDRVFGTPTPGPELKTDAFGDGVITNEPSPYQMYDLRSKAGLGIPKDITERMLPRERVLPAAQMLEAPEVAKTYGVTPLDKQQLADLQARQFELENQHTNSALRSGKYKGTEGEQLRVDELKDVSRQLERNRDIYKVDTSLLIDDPKADLYHHSRVLQRVADEKFGGNAGVMFRRLEKSRIAPSLTPQQQKQYEEIYALNTLQSRFQKQLAAGDWAGSEATAKEAQKHAEQYNTLKADRFKAIEERLTTLADDLSPDPSGKRMDEIRALKAQQELFWVPQREQEKRAVEKVLGPELPDAFKDMAPRDVARILLHTNVLKLDKAQTMGMAMTDEARKYKEAIQILAPIVMLNQGPVEEVDQGFWDTGAKALKQSLTGTAQTAQAKAGAAGELLSGAGVEGGVSPLQAKVLGRAGQPYEPYSKEEWGSIAGGSTGDMLKIVPAALLTEGVAAYAEIPTMLRALSIAAKGGRAAKYSPVLTKWLYGATKEGLNYELAGQVFPDEGDQLNFAAGFTGGAIGHPVGEAVGRIAAPAAARLKMVFGDQAETAMEKLAQYGSRLGYASGKATGAGIAEVGEEFGNTLGPILEKSDTFQQVKDELAKQFPDADSVVHFAATSFVAGALMGEGTTIGRALMGRADDQYKGMTREQRDQFDTIKSAVEAEQAGIVEEATNPTEDATGAETATANGKDMAGTTVPTGSAAPQGAPAVDAATQRSQELTALAEEKQAKVDALLTSAGIDPTDVQVVPQEEPAAEEPKPKGEHQAKDGGHRFIVDGRISLPVKGDGSQDTIRETTAWADEVTSLNDGTIILTDPDNGPVQKLVVGRGVETSFWLEDAKTGEVMWKSGDNIGLLKSRVGNGDILSTPTAATAKIDPEGDLTDDQLTALAEEKQKQVDAVLTSVGIDPADVQVVPTQEATTDGTAEATQEATVETGAASAEPAATTGAGEAGADTGVAEQSPNSDQTKAPAPYVTRNGKFNVTYDEKADEVTATPVTPLEDTWSDLEPKAAQKEKKRALKAQAQAILTARQEYAKAHGITLKAKPNTLKEMAAEVDGVVKRAEDVASEDLGPLGLALRYFAGGNRMNPNAGKTRAHMGWGDVKGNRSGKSQQEKNAKWLLHEKKGLSAEGIAHAIWEQLPEREDGTKAFDTQEILDAVIDVARSHGGVMSAVSQLKDLIPETDQEQIDRMQREYEAAAAEGITAEELDRADSSLDKMSDDQLQQHWAEMQQAEQDELTTQGDEQDATTGEDDTTAEGETRTARGADEKASEGKAAGPSAEAVAAAEKGGALAIPIEGTIAPAPQMQRGKDGGKKPKRSVPRRVRLLKRALRGIAPGLSIRTHRDPADFQREFPGDKDVTGEAGFYDPATKTIHINIKASRKNTLYHEAAHPVLSAIIANNPELRARLHEELLNDPAFAEYVAFGNSYTDLDEAGQMDEAVVEYLADVASGNIPVSESLWQTITRWLREIARSLGFNPGDINLNGVRDIREFARLMSEAMRGGVEIKGTQADRSGKAQMQKGIKTTADLSERMDALEKRIAILAGAIDKLVEEIPGMTAAQKVAAGERLRNMRNNMLAAARQYELLSRRATDPRLAVDPSQMTDKQLEAFFHVRFGRPDKGMGTTPASQANGPKFSTYMAFDAFMQKAYQSGDLDSMYDAFKLADSSWKVKYVRSAYKTGDAKLVEWMNNIATGAPLSPANQPTTSRTTFYGPGAGPTPPKPPKPPKPGSPPPKPPPPPRPKTQRVNMSVMALNSLLARFGKSAAVKRLRSGVRGQFSTGTGNVSLAQWLSMRPELFKQVMAHEIGHFIDLAVEAVGQGAFSTRILGVKALRKAVYQDPKLLSMAKQLSAKWRGPFSTTDQYRNSAKELVADYLSAMLTDPDMVNKEFPLLHDAFEELLVRKPEFQAAYDEITQMLSQDTLLNDFVEGKRKAREKTIDVITQTKEKVTASLASWLRTHTTNQWHAISGMERKLGKWIGGFTDKLEQSTSFARRESTVFASEFMDRVTGPLHKVFGQSADAKTKAHEYLDLFAHTQRIISERRATGAWIEQNEDAARLALQAIATTRAELKKDYEARILGATTPEELYDIGSEMMGQILWNANINAKTAQADILKNPYLQSVIEAIDSLDLGVQGKNFLLAFNVRGKLLNPYGMGVEEARAMKDRIRKELTPEEYQAVKDASREMSTLFYEVQHEAYKEGLIGKEMWEEVIEPNKENYIPFAVLQYFDSPWVTAGAPMQVGTAQAVADTVFAMQLKVASLNAKRQKQRQAALLSQAYTQMAPDNISIKPARSYMDALNSVRNHKEDNVSKFVMYANGRPHVVSVTGDAGATIEQAMNSPQFHDHMANVMKWGRWLSWVMQVYTVLMPSFLLYNNPLRGIRTAAGRVGINPVLKATFTMGNALRLAKNYVGAANGGALDPALQDLVRRGVLDSPRMSQMFLRDPDRIAELMLADGILAYQVGEGKKTNALGRAVEFMKGLTAGYEAFEKIQNYRAAMMKFKDADLAGEIARRGGIPKPGVAGKSSWMIEMAFPWTRVAVQGMRSSRDLAMDPRTRKGYMARHVLFELMPRLINVAIASGIAAYLIGDDDDDEKDDVTVNLPWTEKPVKMSVLQQAYLRMSPNKLGMGDMIPVGFYDPATGELHDMSEYDSGADVPASFEVRSIRMPASEEGRIFGSALYSFLAHLPFEKWSDELENIGRPGTNPVTAAANAIGSTAIPSISPVVNTVKYAAMGAIAGQNPTDEFRGSLVFNERAFDAGGAQRAWAITAGLMNQFGNAGQLTGKAVLEAANELGVESADPKLALGTSRYGFADKPPFSEGNPLSAMFAHDNYGQIRTELERKEDKTDDRKQAKANMSGEAAQVYDYYYKYRDNLKPGELDETQVRRLQQASGFVRTWNKQVRPRYERAIQLDAMAEAEKDEQKKQELQNTADAFRVEADRLLQEATKHYIPLFEQAAHDKSTR